MTLGEEVDYFLSENTVEKIKIYIPKVLEDKTSAMIMNFATLNYYNLKDEYSISLENVKTGLQVPALTN